MSNRQQPHSWSKFGYRNYHSTVDCIWNHA